MSTNMILVVIGTVIFFAGLLKLGKGQSGGLTQSNRAMTFGGSTIQTNRVGNIAPGAAETGKPNWMALGTAGLGFLTALIGLLTALSKD
jgi:asparagine N-glycosylation enzyme membrane subunit Stt3